MKTKEQSIKNVSDYSKKNIKGITLVALVVTIIVLIILAGVSISLVLGDNGIVNKAKDAKEQNDIAKEKEIIKLAYNEAEIEKKGEKIVAEELNEQLEKDGISASAIGTDIITVVFSDTKRCYTIKSDGLICGPSYDIKGVDYNQEITSANFSSSQIVSGRMAILNVVASSNINRVIIYDEEGKEVKIEAQAISNTGDIIASKFYIYGNKGTNKSYSVLALDAEGNRLINMIEEISIKVR